jgi:hypothetical protein
VKLNDHYDWIVLGNHPAALLNASLVARLGLSVLILPVAPEGMCLSISESGQYFDPESNYLIGLGKSGKVDGLILECLNKLGMLPAEESLIDTQNCVPQVLTSENLLSEFQREFGKPFTKQLGLISALKHSESEYLNYWHSLPRRLTLSSNRKSKAIEPMSPGDVRRKLARSLKAYDPALVTWVSPRKRISDLAESYAKPELTEVCEGLWHAISSGINSDPNLFEMLQILSLSRAGGGFKGGMTVYREFLVNLANRLGVHIPPKVECRRLFIDKGRFTGVQVTSRGNMISTGGGILGCSLEKAYSRASYTGRSWFRRKKKPSAAIGWKFTLAFTVHKEAIPNGILSRLVWQEAGAPPLEIEIVAPADYNVDEPDHRIIYLRTLMPFTLESLKPEFQRLKAGRMMRQLMDILPFIEFHVTRIYPDFREGGVEGGPFGLADNSGEADEDAPPNELTELYGFTTLEAIPDNLKMYDGKGVGSTTGIEGLFVASEESYPALGNLGPTVAALESAAWLAHQSGLAGPFV